MNGELPKLTSAHGASYLQKDIEDVAFATFDWHNGMTASIHVSWLDPNKTRKITLVGSRKMLIYDDVSDDKVTIYDKGFDRVPRIGERMDFDDAKQILKMRAGDIVIPNIAWEEPIKIESAHFFGLYNKW
jgi:predicted dehydrogenase